MKNKIETPMQFAPGFVEGAEKRFPEVDGDILRAKNRVTDFLKSTGKKIKKTEEVRLANSADKTQTDDAKDVNTYNFAKQKHKEITDQAKKLPDLSVYVDGIRKRVDTELKEVADTNFGREARQRLSQMDAKDRARFISKRMNEGDYQTPMYALGAPAYLSGIPDDAHKKLKERYVKEFYPHESALIDSLSELQEMTRKGMQNYNKLMVRIENSVPGDVLKKADKAKNLMQS